MCPGGIFSRCPKQLAPFDTKGQPRLPLLEKTYFNLFFGIVFINYFLSYTFFAILICRDNFAATNSACRPWWVVWPTWVFSWVITKHAGIILYHALSESIILTLEFLFFSYSKVITSRTHEQESASPKMLACSFTVAFNPRLPNRTNVSNHRQDALHTYVSLPVVRNTDTLRGIAVSRRSRRPADSGVSWTSRWSTRSGRAWRAWGSSPALSWWTWCV